MLSFPVPGLSLKINDLVWDERLLFTKANKEQ